MMMFLCKKLNSQKKWRVQMLQNLLPLRRRVVRAAKLDLTNPISCTLYVPFRLLTASAKIVATVSIFLIISFYFVEHYG